MARSFTRLGFSFVGDQAANASKVISEPFPTSRLKTTSRWRTAVRLAGSIATAAPDAAGFVAPGKIILDGDLPPDVVDALIVAMQKVAENQRPENPPPALPPLSPAAFAGDSVLPGAALLPFFNVLLPRPSAGE